MIIPLVVNKYSGRKDFNHRAKEVFPDDFWKEEYELKGLEYFSVFRQLHHPIS
jgi:hypothetical protein